MNAGAGVRVRATDRESGHAQARPAAGADDRGSTMPLVPSVFGLDRMGTVPVQASSAYKVSRTWTGG